MPPGALALPLASPSGAPATCSQCDRGAGPSVGLRAGCSVRPVACLVPTVVLGYHRAHATGRTVRPVPCFVQLLPCPPVCLARGAQPGEHLLPACDRCSQTSHTGCSRARGLAMIAADRRRPRPGGSAGGWAGAGCGAPGGHPSVRLTTRGTCGRVVAQELVAWRVIAREDRLHVRPLVRANGRLPTFGPCPWWQCIRSVAFQLVAKRWAGERCLSSRKACDGCGCRRMRCAPVARRSNAKGT